MTRRTVILGGTAVVIMIAAVSYAVKYSSAQASLPAGEAKTVAVAIARRETLDTDINLDAEMRPYQEIDLRSKVAGYLKFINVDIGDQVKQGQVIASIDTDELTADLARSTAEYKNAKLEYDRVLAVSKRYPGLLAQSEVDKAQADYGMAKANMEHAQTFMDYATIVVPFDGVVTKRYSDPGALIQAGISSSTQAQPIVHIAENVRLRLDFPVPESAVAQINPGSAVHITVQATGQKIESRIARITGMVDSSTRTMEAEVDIDNHDLQLKPGMYAHVSVILDKHDNVLSLPVQAVSNGDKPTVWRVGSSGHIEEVPVVLGMQTPDRVEITSGLNEGDKVIFGSRNSLSIGMDVTPKPVEETRGAL